MKVMHVVEPFSSGIITFIIHLTRELSHHEHVVLHGSRVTADEESAVKKRFPEAVSFRNWENAVREIRPLKDFMAFIALVKNLKVEKPSVVHLHSSKAGFMGRIACFFLRIPVIYTPNGASFLRTDIGALKRKVFRILERVASKFAGHVICCSQSEATEFKAIGINCRYVNNGVKIYDVKKNRSDKIRVATFSLIAAQKNPKAFEFIANSFANDSDIEFYWVGDGDRDQLSTTHINVTGWLDENSVTKMHESIDVYLSTSLWEGLPFSVLEAMNAKACLLLSECVGNVDLVEEGTNGYLFRKPEEAIDILKNLKSNKALTYKMGEESKKILTTSFSASECASKYEKIYLSIC